ncbi:hypothetical protein C8Q76DRAFT_634397, partial [Earliella scabrosa]
MLANDPSVADEIILFDSGATRHMSPHRHRFVSYMPISSKPIHAADQSVFQAVGKGDMFVELPTAN